MPLTCTVGVTLLVVHLSVCFALAMFAGATFIPGDTIVMTKNPHD